MREGKEARLGELCRDTRRGGNVRMCGVVALIPTNKHSQAQRDTVCDMVLTGRRGNFSGLAYLANYGPITLELMFGRCLGSPSQWDTRHSAIMRCNRHPLLSLTGGSYKLSRRRDGNYISSHPLEE